MWSKLWPTERTHTHTHTDTHTDTHTHTHRHIDTHTQTHTDTPSIVRFEGARGRNMAFKAFRSNKIDS